MRQDLEYLKRTATTLGPKTELSGKLNFDRSLTIEGKYEGEISASGFLYIAEDAEVHANIRVKSLVVSGIVYGDIVAEEKLEMLETSRVFGDVKTSRLKIADGVLFDGACEMLADADTIDIFSSSVDHLKKTLGK